MKNLFRQPWLSDSVSRLFYFIFGFAYFLSEITGSPLLLDLLIIHAYSYYFSAIEKDWNFTVKDHSGRV